MDSRTASPTCGRSRTTTPRCSRSSSSASPRCAKATGNVLDQSIILFGSNMANSDAHNNDPLPQALIGRGGGLKGNQHLHYPQDTPHANILVTMLHRAGVPAQDIEKFADNTGAVPRKCNREGPLILGDRGGSRWSRRRSPKPRHRRRAVAPRRCGLSSGPARANRTSTVATPTAARRCSGRSTTATSPRPGACCAPAPTCRSPTTTAPRR